MKFLLRKQKSIVVSSSGIKYDRETNGPIAWYTMKILVDHQLTPFMSDAPVRTTLELLQSQDMVIFLDEISHDYCKRRLGYKGRNHDIWNTEYLPPEKTGHTASIDRDIYIIKRSEQIFAKIAEQCRVFVNDLSVTDIPYTESLY